MINLITLKDGTKITEKTTIEQNEIVFNYYLGRRFVFGVLDRFSKSDLQRLYDNGYFMWCKI